MGRLSRQPGTGGRRGDRLVFPTRRGTPLNDGNLSKRALQPAGRTLGLLEIGWHTLRRTHATASQAVRGPLKDAPAQLARARLTTTLELDTQIIPAHQRAAVENLPALMANDGQFNIHPGPPFAHVQPNR